MGAFLQLKENIKVPPIHQPSAGIAQCGSWYYARSMTVAGPFHLSSLEHILLTEAAVPRLLMACAMGGLIGVEREWRHKDSGLRTNMLICMGAALFTLMGAALAGNSEDKSRVASNIVQGIGFLGAGLILHTRNRVLGLTSAASVFVVAAIGMTCGAGLYFEAAFATAIVLISLQAIGAFEARLGWKRYPMLYEVRADIGMALPKQSTTPAQADAEAGERETARHRMFAAILKVLDADGQRLHVIDRDNIAGLERVSFSVMETRQGHARILTGLRASDATDAVIAFTDDNDE